MLLNVVDVPGEWIFFPQYYPVLDIKDFDEWFELFSSVYLNNGDVSPRYVDGAYEALRSTKVEQTPGFISVMLHLQSSLEAPLFAIARVEKLDSSRSLAELSGAYDSDVDRLPIVDTLKIGEFENVRQTIATYSDSSGKTWVRLSLVAEIDSKACSIEILHRDGAMVMNAIDSVYRLFETWQYIPDRRDNSENAGS